jgi:hypothetical protein
MTEVRGCLCGPFIFDNPPFDNSPRYLSRDIYLLRGGRQGARRLPMEIRMNGKKVFISMLALLLAVPAFAGDKKKRENRVMIEKMEAVPCGAKEHGMTGLGSVWASVGITSVNSDEKLCPQYLLRSDDMEYHVRPLDRKHPVLLPIGQEGEFKLKKDKLDMRVVDGDHKVREYQVVAMKPIDHSEASGEESKYDLQHKDFGDKPVADKSYQDKNIAAPAVQPNEHPQ